MSEQKNLDNFSESEKQDLERKTVYGIPPKDWISEHLGKIVKIVSGSSFPKKYQQKRKDGYPVIKVEDMNNNYKYMKKIEYRVSKDEIEDLKHSLYPKNTVILPKVGAALLTNKRRLLNEKSSFDNNIMGWVPTESINPEFLFYISNVINMEAVAQKGAVPSISKSIASALKIPLPPSQEQRKIATVLYNVDQAIQKTETIIEQIKRVKKGLMQDLFTHGYFEHELIEHERLGQMPKDWKIKKIDDISEVNPDSFSADEFEGNTFDYITLSNVSKGEILKVEPIPTEEAPSRAKRIVKNGDVLIGTVRPKQKSHAKVTKKYDGMVCSTGFSVIRPKSMNSELLAQEIFTHRFFSQMEAYVAGSGYPAVKNSDVKKIKIVVPPKEEQNKIATVLSEFDDEIVKLNEQKQNLKKIKKVLMQDLLTGKVRTNDKPIEIVDKVKEVEDNGS